MSDIIFKLNNPLTLEKGTGVSLSRWRKGFMTKRILMEVIMVSINVAIGQGSQLHRVFNF